MHIHLSVSLSLQESGMARPGSLGIILMTFELRQHSRPCTCEQCPDVLPLPWWSDHPLSTWGCSDMSHGSDMDREE